VASTKVRSPIRRCARASTSRDSAPASERAAERAAASVLASIRSATASACARSSLSFRKAQVRRGHAAGDGFGFGAGFEAAREQQLQHHGAAMRLQLEHVFAGVGVRRGEEQRQALVDGRTLRVAQRAVVRHAGRQLAAGDRLRQRGQAATGDAHDADGAAAGRGGDGSDRVVGVRGQSRRHRGIVIARCLRVVWRGGSW
jgi:hypothetical protein